MKPARNGVVTPRPDETRLEQERETESEREANPPHERSVKPGCLESISRGAGGKAKQEDSLYSLERCRHRTKPVLEIVEARQEVIPERCQTEDAEKLQHCHHDLEVVGFEVALGFEGGTKPARKSEPPGPPPSP